MDLRECQRPLKDGTASVRRTRGSRSPRAARRPARPSRARWTSAGGAGGRGPQLGVSRAAPVGFESIRLRLEVDARAPARRSSRVCAPAPSWYCTVLQTLLSPPPIETVLVADGRS